MPNGQEMINDMEFEKSLSRLTGDELTRFVARQLYIHCKEDRKLTKKTLGFTTGAASMVGAVVVSLVNYFSKT